MTDLNSDNEEDSKKQTELCEAVLNLNRRSQLKKASRAEPALEISEFGLVKSLTGKKGSIKIKDLTKRLNKNAKQGEIIKNVGKNQAKTLPMPLEKPQADRIRRTAAFGKVQKELNRWEAVVTSNRSADNLSFPLPTDNTLDANKKFGGFRLKTKLQQELEAIEPEMEVYNVETEEKFPLTMQEMLERRQEMARMRALQSYSEAKARRQGRIKSKKYHRVQKKAKIKEKIKEFEKLQESDPTEALKKLEEIERVRAEERATLRHRNTGKWAQNKQVRAKYDKESRQVLAQQLSISRELTQKIKNNNDDSDEDDDVDPLPLPKRNENNPWTDSKPADGDVSEFLSDYKKFLQDQSSKGGTSSESKPRNKAANMVVQEVVPNREDVSEKRPAADEATAPEPLSLSKSKKKRHNQDATANVTKLAKTSYGPSPKANLKLNSFKRVHESRSKLKKVKLSKAVKKSVGTTVWKVQTVSQDTSESEPDSPSKSLNFDKMFDKLDENLKNEFNVKYKKLKKNLERDNNSLTSQKMPKRKPKTTFDLTIPKSAKRPIIDEELIEESGPVTNKQHHTKKIASLKSILKDTRDEQPAPPKPTQININPNSIIQTKTVALDNENPDLMLLEDDDEDADENSELKGTISEAFEDVDIVEDFKKDKDKEIQNDTPEDVNLTLPGWGSWGGVGIRVSKRKKRRFIVKFPKNMKRKDASIGNLIINENSSAKIKPHLVSEVPFPFKTIHDYEASIRAPIGNTFVPEVAFNKMTTPAVKTKLGTIIEPMTDDILLEKNKRKKF